MSKTTVYILVGAAIILGLAAWWKMSKKDNGAMMQPEQTQNSMVVETTVSPEITPTASASGVATDAQLDLKMDQVQQGITKLDSDQKAVDQINQSADTPPEY